MNSVTPPQRAQIDAEVSRGRLIQAIKLYREFTGVGLKEAKDAVEAWAAGKAPASDAAAPPVSGIRPEFERELKRLLQEGQKIEAIRRFRQETGKDLKDSKEAIDALERDMPQLARKSGCLGILLLGCILAAGAAWLLR